MARFKEAARVTRTGLAPCPNQTVGVGRHRSKTKQLGLQVRFLYGRKPVSSTAEQSASMEKVYSRDHKRRGNSEWPNNSQVTSGCAPTLRSDARVPAFRLTTLGRAVSLNRATTA